MSHSSRVLQLCHPELCSWKTHALSSLFTNCTVKKTRVFYELRIGRISLNISLSDSVLETKILQAKVLNSTAELSQFVNYCRLWTLSMVRYFDSLSLVQPTKLFEPFWQGLWLGYCSVLYESTEHADDTEDRKCQTAGLKIASTLGNSCSYWIDPLVQSHQQRYPLDFCEIALDNSNPRYSPLLMFHFILNCFVFLYLIITHQVSVQSSFPCMSYS